MTSAHVIVGFDERVDEHGVSHPWRMVAMGARLPAGRAQYLMALPDGRRYYSPPRHPLYGDLTALGSTLGERMAQLARTLSEAHVGDVHLEQDVAAGNVGRTLIWHGIEPRGHVVHDVADGMLRDPFSIGGHAGHQIAVIELKLRNAL